MKFICKESGKDKFPKISRKNLYAFIIKIRNSRIETVKLNSTADNLAQNWIKRGTTRF